MRCLQNEKKILLINDNFVKTETVAILTNAHAIAINQDPLGKQATLVVNTTDTQVWAKPLAEKGAWAIALLNRGTQTATIQLKLTSLPGAALSYDVQDLWADGKSLGKKTGSVAATVEGTAAAFYKLVPASE